MHVFDWCRQLTASGMFSETGWREFQASEGGIEIRLGHAFLTF